MSSTILFDKLQQIEQLAQAGRWRRMLHRPVRYLGSLLWREVIYSKTKKGKVRVASTFFDISMQLLLPASMDIYLLGAKTHDSEIRLTRWLLQHLKEGHTFIDVGAHFGFFSLLASKLVGKNGKVFAFDAAPNTFQLLEKNTAPFTNITAIHSAVSNQKDTLTFHEFPILYSEYNTLHPEQFQKEKWFEQNQAREVQVPSIRLDDYLTTNQLNPDCIKIDVEGAEEQVLEGLVEHLQRQSLKVITECTLLSINRHLEMQRNLARLQYFPFSIAADGALRSVEHIEDYLRNKKLESDNFVFQKV
ncbi:MAG: FkbM family methyltransferase [Bacteroidota bacterium]